MEARKYIDRRGWKYKVMGGIGGDTFKARYQMPDWDKRKGWKGVRSLPWRPSFDEAQIDLDRMAQERGWKDYED